MIFNKDYKTKKKDLMRITIWFQKKYNNKILNLIKKDKMKKINKTKWINRIRKWKVEIRKIKGDKWIKKRIKLENRRKKVNIKVRSFTKARDESVNLQL
jgi:hypothetical protein